MGNPARSSARGRTARVRVHDRKFLLECRPEANRTMHSFRHPLGALAVALLGLGLIVVGMVRADAGGPATTKVGYVDLQRTLNETKIGKKARKQLEKDKDAKQKDLDKASKDLEASAAELNKQRA